MTLSISGGNWWYRRRMTKKNCIWLLSVRRGTPRCPPVALGCRLSACLIAVPGMCHSGSKINIFGIRMVAGYSMSPMTIS
mmetsp:Transcript_5498/g.9795  ORF Transcript_5498/g.9795 Transcript_5498/m.9795 type:complete len:80 (-) Transcript_5498:1212-1451(-)